LPQTETLSHKPGQEQVLELQVWKPVSQDRRSILTREQERVVTVPGVAVQIPGRAGVQVWVWRKCLPGSAKEGPVKPRVRWNDQGASRAGVLRAGSRKSLLESVKRAPAKLKAPWNDQGENRVGVLKGWRQCLQQNNRWMRVGAPEEILASLRASRYFSFGASFFTHDAACAMTL